MLRKKKPSTTPRRPGVALRGAAPAQPVRLLPLGALAAGFGLLGAQSLAHGQTPAVPASAASAPRSETTLQQISVKARPEADSNSVRATTSTIGKGNQELRDIPQSVTVVTEKLMEDRRIDTLKEALHQTAGISFMAAEGGEEDIRLRGFSLTASGDIYIDGVRDPAFYDRDTFNFDRIELLRGSASMLFGRGSTGGVVNQVSRAPFLNDASEINWTLGTGSFTRLTGDFNFKTTETSAVRLDVMKTDADNHGNRIDKEGVAPTFRWGVGTPDEFSAGFFYLKNDNGINYGMPWLQGGLVDVSPTNYYQAASDYSAGSATYGTFSHTHRFQDAGTLHTVLRHGSYDRDQRAGTIRFCTRTTNPNTGVVTNPDCPTTPVTQATLNDATKLVRGTQNKVQDLTSTYLQTDYQNTFDWFGRKNDFLAGIDAAREEFNNYTLILPPGVVLDKNTPRPTLGNPNDGTTVDETLRMKVLNRNFVAKALGIYAQDLIEVVPHWKLLGGIRWDRFQGNYTSPTSATTPELNRSDSLWSHRFGVLYQPNDQMTYYASYGTSFNTSGDLYNYDAPGSRADPEKSRNIEVGTKLDLFDGRLTTRVSAFHSTKYNERNRDSPTGQPLVDYLLSGKRHSAGMELDLAGRITPKWEVYGSYAWIPSAKIDQAAFGADLSGEREGTRPSLTPRHSGTIWTTYQFTPQWRVGGGLNARSSQTPNRNPVGIVAPRFVTGDLLAEFTMSEAISFKLNVINVTDKLYADSLYTGHYIPGAARSFQLTMTARF